ncbi:MAG: response regulator, partial [Gemmatimonadales bacterium]
MTAASADETLDLLRRQKLACVLLDLELPGGGDVGLIGRVLQADPSVALLVVSTTPAVEAAVSCLQAGALDYLALPVDHLQLDHRVQRALTCRAARRQQARADRVLRDELTRLTLRLRKTRAGA